MACQQPGYRLDVGGLRGRYVEGDERPLLLQLPLLGRVGLDVGDLLNDLVRRVQEHLPLTAAETGGWPSVGQRWLIRERVNSFGDEAAGGGALEEIDDLLNTITVPSDHEVNMCRQDSAGPDDNA